MVPRRVTTIDTTDEHLIGEFGPGAARDLADDRITMVMGNSNEKLAEVLRAHAPDDHPVLVYLDAHGVGNPLLEELDALGNDPLCRDRCVIAIHDFLVPGKPWGYNWADWGRGAEPLSYAAIEGQAAGDLPRRSSLSLQRGGRRLPARHHLHLPAVMKTIRMDFSNMWGHAGAFTVEYFLKCFPTSARTTSSCSTVRIRSSCSIPSTATSRSSRRARRAWCGRARPAITLRRGAR
jgi:hypothetical protein